MPQIIKNIPLNTNRERLIEVIRLQYPNAVLRFAEHNPDSPYIEIDDDNADDSILTTIVETHNPAILTATQQNTATDVSERANLLAQATAALNQIETDLTALQAATTLAQVRPIVENVIVRQRQIIRTLRGIVRSGLS